MLRASLVVAALVMGCSGDSPQVPDVRFEVRDAVIDPRDQLTPDASPDVADVTTSVDITVFDAPTFDALDASAPDVSISDAFLDVALDRPLLTDTPPTLCTELAEQYAAAVREASVCGSAAECGRRVCETLCCACEVFVSATVDQMRALDDLRLRAERMGCNGMFSCPSMRCPPPLSGQCSTDGRCVTLRAPADASADR
jgi:hypothetical protein